MKFANKEHTIETLVGFFNQDKINLIPRFQRGTVWKSKDRKKLLVNMVQARPIPAIFLYKEAQGPQFTYNILDGKQRLESLLLFIGDSRSDIKINGVQRYFYQNPAKRDVNFSIPLDGKQVSFEKLDDDLVRAFREYPIPTIEISFDDDNTTINEIVDLFIDINQQGVKVTRFQIVQARTKDKLFRQMFGLIALKQVRGKKSKYFRLKKRSPFVSVMKRLAIISHLPDSNSQVERMWERLTEIALFSRSQKHRAPVAILKAFIASKDEDSNFAFSMEELTHFRRVFEFLDGAYKQRPELLASKLATDQPQFYTLVTTLLSTDVMTRFSSDLGTRLLFAAQALDGQIQPPSGLNKNIKLFRDFATKQTTNPDRRERRQEILLKLIEQYESDI